MRTIFSGIIVLISIALNANAQTTNTNSTAEANEYRNLNPSKTGDGFSTAFTTLAGKLDWTTNGWLVCEVLKLEVVGTATEINGVRLILAEDVKCVDGQIATKDYGVIRAREFKNSRGERVPRMLMTPETITKIRRALENKAKSSDENK